MNIKDGPEGFMGGEIMHGPNIPPGAKSIKMRPWCKWPKVMLERWQLWILEIQEMMIIRMFTGDIL